MTTKIKVTDFDFDTIKSDFKSFLSTRPEFTDYNFEGSNLNVLLDILSYNSHYHALMANFLANEMFLDTAAKRSSVVSHAKTLGYVPKSKSSAKATINLGISFTNDSGPGSSFLFQKGKTQFKTNIDGTNYIFTTASNYTGSIVRDGLTNNYSVDVPNVVIYEGTYTTNTVIYNALTKFVNIPDIDIDLSTLIVEVKRPQTEEYDSYTYAKNVLEAGASDRIYFLQEGFSGQYQVYFGDGIFGVQPADGSAIKMSYIVTNGVGGNGAVQWILNNPNSNIFKTNYATSSITGLSQGGSNRETIESVRFNSISHFGTQNRAVVADDYAILAKQYSNNIRHVLAWGGEDNIPPVYNSVVICAIPEQGEDLTDTEKADIKTFLRKKAVGATQVVFKTPEYLDMLVDVKFTYDSNLIKISVFELESNVRDTINTYAKDNLYNFSVTFKQSKFLTTVDRVNDAITGTNLTLALAKTLSVQTFFNQTHVVDFSNALDTADTKPCITSTSFYTNTVNNLCYLADDRNGSLFVYTIDGYRISNKAVGVVDYSTGKLAFEVFINSFSEKEGFRVFGKPANNNIYTNRNNILRIKNENVTVSSRGE